MKSRVSARVESTAWLNHIVRAYGQYNRRRGDYFAAGITYFTVLSIFPLLMVAFSVAGFVLHAHPDLLAKAHDQVVQKMPGSFGTQVGELIDRAVNSRTAVGVLGLLGAAWSGLGWMANLRAALTEQWETQHETGPWWKTKISDLLALIGLLMAMAVSLGASAVRSDTVTRAILRALHLESAPGATAVINASSVVVGIAVSWALLTWIIARLPREPVRLSAAVRAGLLAALIFEVFKQVAEIYLAAVLKSPAGAVFGPILGLMVFVYVTYRILLFATAWAATADRDQSAGATVPAPAVIAPRVVLREGPSVGQAAGLLGVGALGAALLARTRRPGRP